MSLNIRLIRQQFPILDQKVFNQPLVYFDNAATTQKPLKVIQAIQDYYQQYNANVHRGVHHLSQIATEAFESGRKRVASFINAARPHEIIMTRGTTEAINLVAQSFGKKFISEGSRVLVTAAEHHANLVPWQMICREKGAKLEVIPLDDTLQVDMEAYRKMLGPDVRLVAAAHVSNALGTVHPVAEMIAEAHRYNIPVLVDGAQGIVHQPVDVQALGCDFYTFSGHKLYGPMGTGFLYGRKEWLEEMPPWQTGGEMIREVTYENSTFNDLPYKFEAGTPDVAGMAGMHAAIDYLDETGWEEIIQYETELMAYLTEKMSEIEDLELYGSTGHRAGVLSMNIRGVHHYDAGTLLDKMGIAVRTGHHCAQPLMNLLGITGTIRASIAFYNTRQEVDRLAEGLKQVINMLK
ncbi:MAG: cysteine desulfurase [Bacteroidales bacterium]